MLRKRFRIAIPMGNAILHRERSRTLLLLRSRSVTRLRVRPNVPASYFKVVNEKFKKFNKQFIYILCASTNYNLQLIQPKSAIKIEAEITEVDKNSPYETNNDRGDNNNRPHQGEQTLIVLLESFVNRLYDSSVVGLVPKSTSEVPQG